MPNVRSGLVSVILVNYKGAPDTIAALGHLRQLNWPADDLEIIVVDNQSNDGSVEAIRAADPGVILVESPTNSGFAGGCNLGVSRSSGEFVAFLNNDARPDAEWVAEAVRTFRSSARIGAVASKVLDWDGVKVDFIGSALTWYGMGYKPFTAEKFSKDMPVPTDVLFGTGSAMFVRRDVFDALEGFDERYFMFFEDVDFGWRLNLRGWRYAYAPGSIAFHKHHASMAGFGQFKENYLLERNALFTLYKNLEQASLDQALPAALALSVRRGVARAGLDSESLDLRRPGGDAEETTPVAKDLLSSTFAIDRFVAELPSLKASRDEIQASRVVADSQVWPLFGLTDMPAFQDPYYLQGYEAIADSFDVTEAPIATKVVVVTGDPIGPKLAGPAIRAWNIAETLARENEVVLATLSGFQPTPAPFDIVRIHSGIDREFARLEQWADVILFQGNAMAVFESLQKTDKIVIADIYDPMHLEQLEQSRGLGAAEWSMNVATATDVLNEQLSRGDFFLCASERQKHFYLGQLAALGRVNPLTYANDPDLDGLISVVPFGLSEEPPVHERDVLKGVLPGIAAKDKLVLWSGGLYNWFDPQTLVRAMALLDAKRGGVRLFFQGTKHPNPGVPEMAIVAETRALAAELGVLDRAVFLNDSWVDYADRQNYLTEADAGVSTHHAHLETTFSFRTRILDYLWAGLPMVLTAGDHFADLVEREKLGVVVPAGDPEALAAGLEKVLFDTAFIAEARANIARVRQQYFWSNVLAPVVDFVRRPHRAQDAVGAAGPATPAARRSAPRRKRAGLRHDLSLVSYYLKHGGPGLVFRKIGSRLRRR